MAAINQNQPVYKVCLIGGSGVDKINLIKSWLGCGVGADHGEVYRYNQLHYVNADAIVVLCDLTSLKSSLRQVRELLTEAKSIAADAAVILCGNKADQIGLVEIVHKLGVMEEVLGVKAGAKVSGRVSAKVSTKVLPISTRRIHDCHRVMGTLLSQLVKREVYPAVGECC
jgi:GTPase SAR1 family protein